MLSPRYHLITLILLLSSALASAQYEGAYLEEWSQAGVKEVSRIMQATDQQGKTSFENQRSWRFRKDGQLENITWFNKDSTVFGSEEHFYNEAGQCIEMLSQTQSYGGEYNHFRTYAYTDEGLLREERHLILPDSNVNQRLLYHYDEKDRLQAAETFQAVYGDTVIDGERLYNYVFRRFELQQTMKFYYHEDRDVEELVLAQGKILRSRSTLLRNKNGSVKTLDILDPEGSPKFRTQTVYHADGSVRTETRYHTVRGAKKLIRTSHIEFADGRPNVTTQYEHNMEVVKRVNQHSYTYDKRDQVTERKVVFGTGDESKWTYDLKYYRSGAKRRTEEK